MTDAGHKGARGHRLGRAAVVVPFRAAAGLGGGSGAPRRDGPLPAPLDAEVGTLDLPGFGALATYSAGTAGGGAPLLLVHSVNAAGSAYEIKPIFDRLRETRPVYALDLPGFGLSDRPQRRYTPRIMTDAVLAAAEAVRAQHGGAPIDALALSLSSEFLARAAAERPDTFRSLALVSPTGFDRRGPRMGPPGATRGMPALYNTFTVPLWRAPFFRLLTSRVSIRYFLEKTWGSKAIDEGLLGYDLLATRQPGAEHAPYSFIGGYLFSADIGRVYEGLGLPVWFVHGVRGDFTDYSSKTQVASKPNWRIDVMETGALPQFERLDEFTARYDAFLASRP